MLRSRCPERDGDADAGPHIYRDLVQFEGALTAADPGGDGGQFGVVDAAGHDDGELVTAEAGGDGTVVIRDGLGDATTELDEQFVARIVTEGVVDLLELIDVEQHHPDQLIVATPTEARPGLEVEHHPVRQRGQPIVKQVIAQLVDEVFVLQCDRHVVGEHLDQTTIGLGERVTELGQQLEPTHRTVGTTELHDDRAVLKHCRVARGQRVPRLGRGLGVGAHRLDVLTIAIGAGQEGVLDAGGTQEQLHLLRIDEVERLQQQQRTFALGARTTGGHLGGGVQTQEAVEVTLEPEVRAVPTDAEGDHPGHRRQEERVDANQTGAETDEQGRCEIEQSADEQRRSEDCQRRLSCTSATSAMQSPSTTKKTATNNASIATTRADPDGGGPRTSISRPARAISASTSAPLIQTFTGRSRRITQPATTPRLQPTAAMRELVVTMAARNATVDRP